jgi:single-strand DNA-binding protein
MVAKTDLVKKVEERECVNSVILRGRVSSFGVEKILPSEDRVVEFRLVLNRDSRPGVDVLDIGAWNSKARRKALTLKIDDWVEIEGSIHRRFWQSGHGLASRWQIEASEISKI